MNIISVNDWKRLSEAFRRKEEFTLTRTLGDLEVTAEVTTGDGAWGLDVIVGIIVMANGRVRQRQWFRDPEYAQQCVRKWRY